MSKDRGPERAIEGQRGPERARGPGAGPEGAGGGDCPNFVKTSGTDTGVHGQLAQT